MSISSYCPQAFLVAVSFYLARSTLFLWKHW